MLVPRLTVVSNTSFNHMTIYFDAGMPVGTHCLKLKEHHNNKNRKLIRDSKSLQAFQRVQVEIDQN